jgi:hypothetical protein
MHIAQDKERLCYWTHSPPGAVEQLKTHCTRLKVPLYERGYEKDPAKVGALFTTGGQAGPAGSLEATLRSKDTHAQPEPSPSQARPAVGACAWPSRRRLPLLECTRTMFMSFVFHVLNPPCRWRSRRCARPSATARTWCLWTLRGACRWAARAVRVSIQGLTLMYEGAIQKPPGGHGGAGRVQVGPWGPCRGSSGQRRSADHPTWVARAAAAASARPGGGVTARGSPRPAAALRARAAWARPPPRACRAAGPALARTGGHADLDPPAHARLDEARTPAPLC